MPNPDYDYLQQHFLKTIINVHWGEKDVTLQWTFFYEQTGGGSGGSCSPPSLVRPESDQIIGGYILSLFLDDTVHNPNPLWTPDGVPSVSPSAVHFPTAKFASSFISEDGSAFFAGVSSVGMGGGSLVCPIFGTLLNEQEGCYFRPDGNPDFGQFGVGLIDVDFPHTNTGEIFTLSWPDITITNTETNETWDKFHFHASGRHQSISLTITFFESEQN